MSDITYQQIQHLVADKVVQGSSVTVEFKCPDSGVTAEGRGSIRRSQDVAATAERSAKQSLFYSLRSSLTSALSGALGHGALGRAGREVSNQVMRNVQQSQQFSSGEVNEGIVDAFRKVQKQFKLEGGRWVGASVSADVELGPFEKQLAEHPVSERYDQGVLARMLVEIAGADGQLEGEEREFVAQFVGASLGSVEDLLTRPPLTPIELGETQAGGARETMLMLALAVAYSDHDLAEKEKARLLELGAGLEIGNDRLRELIGYAQGFLVDKALEGAYQGGQRNDALHGEAMQLAAGLGMSREDAERQDVQVRKRLGIV